MGLVEARRPWAGTLSGPTAAYSIPGYPEGISNCGVCAGTCDDADGCTTDLCVPGGVVGTCQHFNRNRCATARCGGGGYFNGSGEGGLPNQSACAGPDGDLDRIPDAWEVASTNPYTGASNGAGIDINCDGVIDGADFQYPAGELPSLSSKDVYLKIVAMGQRPGDGSIDCSANGDFDCLTAGGPPYCDGVSCTDEPPTGHAPLQSSINLAKAGLLSRGITLHAAPPTLTNHGEHLKFFTTDVCDLNPFTDYFTEVKAPNWNSKLQYVYRFAVFAHHWCRLDGGNHPSGNSEIIGNDLSVTLGDAIFSFLDPDRAMVEAGALTHQLGHSLGLTELLPPRAPNHLSVMNHRYQFTGISTANQPITDPPTAGATRVDFSAFDMADLDENHLNENALLQASSLDTVTFNCPTGAPRRGHAGSPIDWNCNGVTGGTEASETDTQVNVDGVTPIVFDNHYGRNDLPLLEPQFQCRVTFQDGAALPGDMRTEGELTLEDAEARHELLPILDVPIDVRPECATNWIFLGSKGTVVVALLGTTSFDVSQVDLPSLEFAGATPLATDFEDLDNDGNLDLKVMVKQSAMQLTPSSSAAILTGWLKNSQAFQGSDAVQVSNRPQRRAGSCDASG